MRTIKFQLVFDTAIGKYITKQSYTIEDFLNFIYGLDCLLEKETGNFGMHDHDAFFSYEPKFIAKRQFTGLLDKNGVEVYEGDILPLNIHYTKGNFVVSWDEENALFRACLCGSGHCWKLETLNFKHIEVIGNIYEHPHLLEANHD